MTTIQDVAKRAGVAPITVSRFINNSGYCSAETRIRVESAIAELGYVPNRLASGLRSKHSKTLALVVTDITNPFFTTIARGVEDTANDAGFIVIFCNTDEDLSKENNYLHMLLEQRVGGIILVPALSVPDSVAFIRKHETPVVVLDRRISGAKTDVVRCDSEKGAYQLVQLLLSLGHQNIAMLSGPRGTSTAEDRVAGFKRALSEVHLESLMERVQYGSFTQQSGYDMTILAMAKTPRPTALFAANNFIAIGASKALQTLNLSVPEEVALVGFDDLPPTLITFPFLTVASQPAYEMGQKATEILLAQLSNDPPEEFQEIILPAEIVVRKSSGMPIGPPIV
ncbi:MAG TPA: LacI family DNA-binding transcriptional regulator [Leptolinea sp.]